MPPRLQHCTCPRDGAFLCLRCRALLARANGCPIEAMPLKASRMAHNAPGMLGGVDGGGVSEDVLLEAVRGLAKAHGWLCYHTHNSKRSEPGFFDVVLAKAGHPILLVELKSSTGIVTRPQQAWQDVVPQVCGVEAHVWRPAQWLYILEMVH